MYATDEKGERESVTGFERVRPSHRPSAPDVGVADARPPLWGKVLTHVGLTLTGHSTVGAVAASIRCRSKHAVRGEPGVGEEVAMSRKTWGSKMPERRDKERAMACRATKGADFLDFARQRRANRMRFLARKYSEKLVVHLVWREEAFKREHDESSAAALQIAGTASVAIMASP